MNVDFNDSLLSLSEIESAANSIRDYAIETPLIRFPQNKLKHVDVWLKLENLQSIGIEN
jgi:threonine dehydratase